MRLTCKRCSKKEFEVPNYTSEEKKLLSKLKADHKLVALIQKIKSLYELESIDAKFSYTHINSQYGKCIRCKNDSLEGEYVECPKCNALNFNWNLE